METDHRYFKENIKVIAASLFIAFSGYVFHFITGRKLGPESYGLIVSLLAIIYIVDIFLYSVQSTVATKIAEAKANNKDPRVYLKAVLYKNLRYGFIFSLAFIIMIPAIAKFLNTTDYISLLILNILIFVSFLLPITRGFLQGTQQFNKLSINYVAEGLSKVSSLIILFYFGGGPISAMLSLSLSYLVPFLVTLISLPQLNVKLIDKIGYKLINPVTFIIAILALFYSVDILLVKHLFTAYEAGIYSAASLYGKVILFSAIPIAMVLLPKCVETRIKNGDTVPLLKKALLLICLIGIPAIIIYFTFPEILVKLTLGEKYLQASQLIGYYSIATFLLSVSYLLSFYLISLKQESKTWMFMLIIWLIEPLLIYAYHGSIVSIIFILDISAAILTLFLSVYIINLRKASKII